MNTTTLRALPLAAARPPTACGGGVGDAGGYTKADTLETAPAKAVKEGAFELIPQQISSVGRHQDRAFRERW